VAIGLDLAYSSRKNTDFWAVVAVAASGGFTYVLHVWRGERGVDDARKAIAEARAIFPGAPLASYVSGPEIGVYEDLANDRENPIEVELLPARWSKYVRAQPLARRWNKGRVLVPERAPWLADYLAEMAAFSGRDGDTDDQVDATVSAFDMIADSIDVAETGSAGFFYGARVL
jgi:predicted phage terminase large subunit-like protein